MFDDRATQRAFYEAFFEELESIEKNAMLQKEALGFGKAIDFAKGLGERIAGSNIGKGFKTLATTAPDKVKGLWGEHFKRGVQKADDALLLNAAKAGGGGDVPNLSRFQKLRAGVGEVLRSSPSAQAAAVGAGGLAAVPVATGAAGYAMGRGGGPGRGQPQPS